MPVLALAGPFLQGSTAMRELLAQRLPGWSIVNATDEAASLAEVAVCWNQPSGLWPHLRAVRLAHSIGAGVDHLLADPGLPDIAICKVIDGDQVLRMEEYVRWSVLYYHRGFDVAASHQRGKVWQRPPNRRASQVAVGVMGMGQMGAQIASSLHGSGYDVRGWSRSGKAVPGMRVFGGADGLGAFLGELDILVCLLPLTLETAGILDSRLFARLKPGAVLVHCGRGPHLVEADLIAALDSAQLGGAVVDVFAQEPLPADSPLWHHPRVVATPHMAAVMPLPDVADQIAENCARLLAGAPLLRVVDRAAGY